MKNTVYLLSAILLFSCGDQEPKKKITINQEELSKFLAEYNVEYQRLLVIASEAEWKLNTYIVEGDTVSGNAASAANQQMVDFTGSELNIEKAMMFLEVDSLLTNLERRQLNTILYKAGGAPAVGGAGPLPVGDPLPLSAAPLAIPAEIPAQPSNSALLAAFSNMPSRLPPTGNVPALTKPN